MKEEGHASEILSQVPWNKLLEWVRDYSEDRSYKGKATVIHLRNGVKIEGAYKGYSRDKRSFMVESELGTKVVPLDNILLFNIGHSPHEQGSRKDYSFGGLSYTLADFPRPFVAEDGCHDVTFVIGEGSRDYDDHREFLRKVGEKALPSPKPGRRGDFDYLPTLAFALGGVSATLSKGRSWGSMPVARQGFVAAEEVQSHNVVTIGSGAVNTFTKEILGFYGDNLPIRFGSNQTDDEIVDEVGERRVYSRKKDPDWNVGIIEMVPNPFAPTKVVLIVAGLTVTGTQAGLLALSQNATRKILHDRTKRVGSESITVPAQIVRATEITYLKGIEKVDSYELIT